MSEKDSYIAAIAATPDSDKPKLDYADWLDKKGDPRGAFIRVQLALAEHPDSKAPERITLLKQQRKLLLDNEGLCTELLNTFVPSPYGACGYLGRRMFKYGMDKDHEGSEEKDFNEAFKKGFRTNLVIDYDVPNLTRTGNNQRQLADADDQYFRYIEQQRKWLQQAQEPIVEVRLHGKGRKFHPSEITSLHLPYARKITLDGFPNNIKGAISHNPSLDNLETLIIPYDYHNPVDETFFSQFAEGSLPNLKKLVIPVVPRVQEKWMYQLLRSDACKSAVIDIGKTDKIECSRETLKQLVAHNKAIDETYTPPEWLVINSGSWVRQVTRGRVTWWGKDGSNDKNPHGMVP